MSETPTFTSHRHLDQDPTPPDVRPEDRRDEDLRDESLRDDDLRDDGLPEDRSDIRPVARPEFRHDEDLAEDRRDDDVADRSEFDEDVADRSELDDASERPTAPSAAVSTPDADPVPVVVATPAAAGAPATPGAPAAEATASAPDQEVLTNRWREIQSGFVDDPKAAVRDADALVVELLEQLADRLSAERKQLEAAWREGEHPSTEDLRVNLQHYRTLAQRIISL